MTGSHGWCITSLKQMKQIHLGVVVLELVLWQLIQSALELPKYQAKCHCHCSSSLAPTGGTLSVPSRDGWAR